MLHIIFAVLGAFAFASLYLLGRAVRTVFAWGNNQPGPKERVRFYLVIFAALGAVAGWLAYQPFTAVQQCRAAGEPVVSCAFFPRGEAR